VKVTLNGEQIEVAHATTLTGLLEMLGLRSEQVAVELNRVLVPRAKHEATVLHAGDVLEVVTLVGGG
jgi:sulfur carrier protein